MRLVVKKEPIIPFTDRIRELSEINNISTILVIGGSGEYLKHADVVLLMEDYNIYDITHDIDKIMNKNVTLLPVQLLKARYLKPQQTFMEFAISKLISIDRTHFIKIDSYTTDVTHLSAIISKYQMYLLA